MKVVWAWEIPGHLPLSPPCPGSSSCSAPRKTGRGNYLKHTFEASWKPAEVPLTRQERPGSLYLQKASCCLEQLNQLGPFLPHREEGSTRQDTYLTRAPGNGECSSGGKPALMFLEWTGRWGRGKGRGSTICFKEHSY